MPDVRDLLRRQAAWQQSRRDLPWPVKIRMAEQARDAVMRLGGRRSAGLPTGQVRNSSRRTGNG
jgi:hypothetical protein